MHSLETTIGLPPGPVSDDVVREFFRLVFEEYRWFQPVRYGFAGLRQRLDPAGDVYEPLLAEYADLKVITVAAKTDRDFFLLYPVKPNVPQYAGAIVWMTSAVEAKKPRWREAHARQVAEIMRLVNSPYAYAALDDDCKRKTNRLVPCADGFGQEQVFTVRDYSEGLAGLFWRNFLGAPFVQLFGERLASLPSDTRKELAPDLMLIQPYELPTQAGTPEGEARERELITLLGPECFYDFERHLKPSRLPVLTAP
ncbi:hypothetical protein P2318_32870 [Myxococcaceae bacterium GXIMD 01537]